MRHPIVQGGAPAAGAGDPAGLALAGSTSEQEVPPKILAALGARSPHGRASLVPLGELVLMSSVAVASFSAQRPGYR